MILQTAGLSPNQKPSLEDKAGRKLQETENTVYCGGRMKIAISRHRVALARLPLAMKSTKVFRMCWRSKLAQI